MGKMAIIAAGGVGYLLGSRAGREPYEKFTKHADKVLSDPRVQKGAAQVKRQAREKANGDPGQEQPTVAGPQGSLP